MLSNSPYALGIVFVTLALMWVLQMSLAKKQATGFLNAVNSIKMAKNYTNFHIIPTQ